jgi:poly(3-hydroxybutyrate) depolymerase
MRHYPLMTNPIAHVALALIVSSAVASTASAELVEKTGRFGGLQVTYKVVLPAGYDPARTYPAILVFTGGPQQLRGAENTLNADWRAEAERRGYIVVSPGTPNGNLFFEDADRIFPEFLDALLKDYRVRGGKLHVAGHSNGGLSAYYVAAKFPSYFTTVIGYPGLLDGQSDPRRIQALKPLCLFMHVGDRDGGWMSAMQRQAESLRAQGFRIRLTVEKGQEHRLRAQEINLSPRLFDEIESCGR